MVEGLGRRVSIGVQLGHFMLACLLDMHVEMLSSSLRLMGEALDGDEICESSVERQYLKP